MGRTLKRRVVAAFVAWAMLFAAALGGGMAVVNHSGLMAPGMTAQDTGSSGMPGKCPAGGMSATSMAGSCIHCGQAAQTAGLAFALPECPAYSLVAPLPPAAWHGRVYAPDPAPPKPGSVS